MQALTCLWKILVLELSYLNQIKSEFMELTSEEIVTNLLTSNEILKKKQGNFYISNPLLDTLSDYLLDIDEEIPPPPKLEEVGKYVFIK